jgi:hypothetical protein
MTRKRNQPNLGRHKRQCSICAHPRRVEIEADFIGWKNQAAIAQERGLADRLSCVGIPMPPDYLSNGSLTSGLR